MTPDARHKLILAGVIAVLAAWVLIPQVLRRVGPAPAQAAGAELEPGSPGEAAVGEPGAAEDDTVASVLAAMAALPTPDTPTGSVWPADPFGSRASGPGPRVPAPAPQAPNLGLALEGIISGSPDAPGPRALIQGQIVAVGDQLAGGYTVTAIDTNSVTLAGPLGPWTLTLPQ